MVYLFGILAIFGGILTVLGRHPIASAMALIFTFFCVSGLFVLLGAHFLFIIQILVYIGAIMVFFVYTVLLMDLKEEDLGKSIRLSQLYGGIVTFFLLLLLLQRFPFRKVPWGVEKADENFGTIREVAKALFSTHLFPFEMVGLLLLAAIVGAFVLAKEIKGGEGA